ATSASRRLWLFDRVSGRRNGIAELPIRHRLEPLGEDSRRLEELLREIVLVADSDEAYADALRVRRERPRPQHRPPASAVGEDVEIAHDPTSVGHVEASARRAGTLSRLSQAGLSPRNHAGGVDRLGERRYPGSVIGQLTPGRIRIARILAFVAD